MRIDWQEKITKRPLMGLRCVVVRHPQHDEAWTLAVPVCSSASIREYVGVWASRQVALHERRLVRAACWQAIVAGLARRANVLRSEGKRERTVQCTKAMVRCIRRANAETNLALAGRRLA